MLDKLYENGINKFPSNINLRTYYSMFLVKQLGQKQKALNEIIDAENLKGNVD